MFGDLAAAGDIDPTPADEAAARLVGDYWTAFARTGDPNGGGRPAWPAYARGADQRLSIGNDGAAASSAGTAALDALGAHQDKLAAGR